MNIPNDKFFVTCGRGLESFALRELSSCPTVFNHEMTDGKIYFEVKSDDISLDVTFERLLQLKTVERLFLCVFLSKYRQEESSSKCKFSPLRDVVHKCVEHVEGEQFRRSVRVLSSCKQPKNSIVGTFRVSSKCAGRAAKRYTPQKLSILIGAAIKRNTDWTTKLRNPDIEVYVHLNDDYLVVGFPLVQLPLSKRSYLKVIALRSTVCWAMASLANIKFGDRVLDPMCGAGTILVETVKSWPLIGGAVGVDIDRDQLSISLENVVHGGVQPMVSLVQGSVQSLPFADHMFDVILCDFPFGLKHGTKKEAVELLPKAVEEIDRVCRIGGHIVFLVSPNLAVCLQETVSSRRSSGRSKEPSLALPRSLCLNSEFSAQSHFSRVDKVATCLWKRLSKYNLNLGELEACIVAYVKKF